MFTDSQAKTAGWVVLADSGLASSDVHGNVRHVRTADYTDEATSTLEDTKSVRNRLSNPQVIDGMKTLTHQLEIMNQKQLAMRTTIDSLEAQLENALREVLHHPHTVALSFAKSMPQFPSVALFETLLRDDVSSNMGIPSDWVEVFSHCSSAELKAHVLLGPPEPLSFQTNGKRLAEDLVLRLCGPHIERTGNIARHIETAAIDGPFPIQLARVVRAALSAERNRQTTLERDAQGRQETERQQLLSEARRMELDLEQQRAALHRLHSELAEERRDRQARVAAGVADGLRDAELALHRQLGDRERERAVRSAPWLFVKLTR